MIAIMAVRGTTASIKSASAASTSRANQLASRFTPRHDVPMSKHALGKLSPRCIKSDDNSQSDEGHQPSLRNTYARQKSEANAPSRSKAQSHEMTAAKASSVLMQTILADKRTVPPPIDRLRILRNFA